MADFGYTTKGSHSGDCSGVVVYGKVTNAPAGLATALNGYVLNTSGSSKNVKFAIYSHDAVNNLPETKLAETAVIAVANGFDGLKTASISPLTLTFGAIYWFAVIGDAGGRGYNGDGGVKFEVFAATYPTFPDPCPNSGSLYSGTEYLSTYATYTPPITGTMAGALGNIAGSISGNHGVAGTMAGALGNVTGAAAGIVRAEGALTGTLAAVIGTIGGTASAPSVVTGTLVGNLAAVTGAIAGVHGETGTIAGTLTNIRGVVSGIVRVEGTLTGILTNLTAAATGAPGLTGEVAGTLTNLTGVVTGAHGAAGTLTGQINSITATISGSVGGIVTGLLAGTLTPITASMIGLVVVGGSLARTLQPVTAAINGTAGPDTAAQWKFPALFSESGFSYSDYDPGQAAAIAIGCLHLYMKTGDSRANTWARRLLDDLRVNRQSPTYPYLYKSDLHYGWLNALVAQAFGLAVTGRPGQAYVFASTREDHDHFLNMVNQFFAMAGDSKPNVLNADRVPFSYVEAVSSWEYAPNYIMNQQMGSLEALVLTLEVALDYARLQGDWDWFNRLLAFILRDNLVVLNQAQIRTVTAACDQAGAANLVRLRYADYDRDSSNYCEARDQAAIDNWGEQALDLDLRYGSPVIMEDPAAAQLLATRMLQRLAPPQEGVEVETWLEGVRIELGDTAAVSSDFHGWDREEFTVLGRDLDLGHRRVRLKLTRPLDRSDPFAVDAGGSASDAWAIDQASSWDENWDSRAYVY